MAASSSDGAPPKPWERERIAGARDSPPRQPASEAVRSDVEAPATRSDGEEDLRIAQAVRFLTHPSTAAASEHDKVAFLRSKGLSAEQIERARHAAAGRSSAHPASRADGEDPLVPAASAIALTTTAVTAAQRGGALARLLALGAVAAVGGYAASRAAIRLWPTLRAALGPQRATPAAEMPNAAEQRSTDLQLGAATPPPSGPTRADERFATSPRSVALAGEDSPRPDSPTVEAQSAALAELRAQLRQSLEALLARADGDAGKTSPRPPGDPPPASPGGLSEELALAVRTLHVYVANARDHPASAAGGGYHRINTSSAMFGCIALFAEALAFLHALGFKMASGGGYLVWAPPPLSTSVAGSSVAVSGDSSAHGHARLVLACDLLEEHAADVLMSPSSRHACVGSSPPSSLRLAADT